ncbi:YvcK family protein [Pelotomaculum terephthalicicum JT]|uniref:gluconeogenesis factor YvcK family protein n=1 Tax=Pelotomaculum TaxID=191373 RepID=UPI0009CD76FB|nr:MULTISPECIES: gluconeogenesis factor YvcK family protein [Pelotomaculum]MCG9967579.1 YvcK family protein [Pelotomaculum terephthalicicum JT]OPX88769.1 MAG: Gluconeogenesis factor [Pelotomaculum sp. PtaB.Bin117]OPY60213.1 MAG: Gluconeogenesis factor [Pelotomaculum sp. PtaU1.Bin065]
MIIIKWFYPGMRVKRWLFMALGGLVFAGVGIDLFTGGMVSSDIADFVHQLEKSYIVQSNSVIAGVFVVAMGIAVMSVGLLKALQSVASVLLPGQEGRLAEFIYEKRSLRRGPKIVVIGGGTGLSVLLRGLKKYTSNLTAIVTVADDGGSSGRLRGDLGILPPGDIRNCLVALADKEPLMEELLQYRFTTGELAGHCMGNLLLAALTGVSGSFDQAVRGLSKVLAVRGRVLPATLSNITLCAELADGTVVQGESSITRSQGKIKRVFIKPQRCLPLAEALAAIQAADAVVLGPGSLYTSVIPNLLVKGIPEALARSSAIKIYVCNVMTQPGETDDYTGSEHLRAIIAHAGKFLDYVLLNTGQIPARLRVRYRQDGASPVLADLEKIEELGVTAVGENLIHETQVVRHHPDQLAQGILRLIMSPNGSQDRVHYLHERRKAVYNQEFSGVKSR